MKFLATSNAKVNCHGCTDKVQLHPCIRGILNKFDPFLDDFLISNIVKNELQRNEQILSQFNEQRFVDDTIAQIEKDLIGLLPAATSWKGKFSKNCIDELVTHLSPVLDELSRNGNLPQFIYRVDLAEKDFKISLKTEGMNVLAGLVIQREALKVYLRQKLM